MPETQQYTSVPTHLAASFTFRMPREVRLVGFVKGEMAMFGLEFAAYPDVLRLT